MKTQANTHRRSYLRLALLGLAVFALPAISSATPILDEANSIAAENECPPPKSTIVLELDVTTGDVYMVDETGGLTLVTGDIEVYVGTLSSVLVDLEYSSGNWEVDVTPDGQPTQTNQTRGGALRYWLDTDYSEYLFSSTELTGMSTMMNMMTPVVPDIVIKPGKNCPPST
ncbi:MAG: hypothetical protein HC927_04135 [Deltaproteobacteria bacterium]|nr:hypothetical protein [Deltaproteobacteria bacterium]